MALITSRRSQPVAPTPDEVWIGEVLDLILNTRDVINQQEADAFIVDATRLLSASENLRPLTNNVFKLTLILQREVHDLIMAPIMPSTLKQLIYGLTP